MIIDRTFLGAVVLISLGWGKLRSAPFTLPNLVFPSVGAAMFVTLHALDVAGIAAIA